MLNISNIIYEQFRLFLSITISFLKVTFLALGCTLIFVILMLIQKHYSDYHGLDNNLYEFVMDLIPKNQSFDMNNFNCITTVNEKVNNIEVNCIINGNTTSETESKIIN